MNMNTRRVRRAKRASLCGYCGGPIWVGQQITESDLGGWVHAQHITGPLIAALAPTGTGG